VIFSPSEVLPIAASTGFRAEMIEKMLHLLNLLDRLNRHPMLQGKWVLKGGFRKPLWDIQPADSRVLGAFQARDIALLDVHELAAGKLALDLLLEKGEINASALTSDIALQERICSQPLLQWKALNVKRHKGLG